MFTFKSTTFSMIGFLLALSGSFLSGARWTFSQLIMQKSAIGLEHPIDLIYHIQPLMILTLLPIAIGIEGREPILTVCHCKLFGNLNIYYQFDPSDI